MDPSPKVSLTLEAVVGRSCIYVVLVERHAYMSWTPTLFNLIDGNPFQYLEHSISAISAMEVFKTGIALWDEDKCVIY